jgi:copper(I)-binding protein
MNRFVRAGVPLLLSMAVCTASFAHQVKHGTLSIAHPFVVADRDCAGAPTRGYLMLVVNEGAQPDRLLGARLDNGAAGTVVRYGTEAGKATVAAVPELEIPANANTALMAPGLAIEFPRQDKLVEGGMIGGSLRFARAGTVPVKFMVEATHMGAGDGKPACDLPRLTKPKR